ncbi:MAG TPA: aldo/keto reductase, partial [Firmicutes bacterium]|nr:aldo/keto reductase [Bacillota bacterium]
TRCTGCGACKPRCPYDLPIPEILKQHYDLFKQHAAAQ